MFRKITKTILIFLILLIIVILYEITVISKKTINRGIVDIDLNNIRNPQIKKVVRYFDNFYASILISYNKEAKSYFNNEDDRNNFPDIKIIKKTENFSKNIYPIKNVTTNWHRNYGNSASNRFSDLKQINRNNLDQLDIAWEYKIGGKKNYDIQSNVIVANNKIFIPSNDKSIIALDALSGKPVWKFVLKDAAPRRGMLYLSDKEKQKSRLFFSSYKNLMSLNASNGRLIKSFGKDGVVKLKKPSITSPAIYKENLIITTSEPSLEVYNLNSGKLLWKYILMEKKNKNRFGGKRYDYSGGNPWGGFSLDEKRGIAFLTTGNAGRYFNGVNRPGNNKFSNSIIAIDIKNKKKLWDFQEVRHDIWNLDIPAPPILGSITKNKKKVDVVIAVTKLGNTIVLDRMSGEPIFDFHLKKAPKSEIPGEKTNFYQPSPDLPQPFAKQNFNLNEVTNIDQESRKYILEKIKNHNYGFFEPYKIGEKNVQFNFHGGAEWPGGSYDLNKEILYVSSSNIAWETEVTLNQDKKKFLKPYYNYDSSFKRLTDKNGYPGSKPPWGVITALNLKNGKIIWQIPFGEYEELTSKKIPITGTENYSGVTGTDSGLLLATGTLDKKFRIFDADNGNELWSYKLPYIGSSPPITYEINKKQYILINATGSFSLKKGYPNLVDFGDKIIAFKLKKK
jgi:quinoprotein glucose dehydrogenase